MANMIVRQCQFVFVFNCRIVGARNLDAFLVVEITLITLKYVNVIWATVDFITDMWCCLGFRH